MTDQLTSENEKFVVRLPSGLRDRIRDAAAASNRSMNAEIVDTLEEKYPAFNALENFDSSLQRARAEALIDYFSPRAKSAVLQVLEDFERLRSEILRHRRK